MTSTDCIAITSVGVVILGWIINIMWQRCNDIEKERRKLRLKLALSILDLFNKAQAHVIINKNLAPDSEFKADLVIALSHLAFLGKQEERALGDIIFEKLKTNQPIGDDLTRLTKIVCDGIKKELKIK